jgi:hypothetical protein
VPIAFGLNSYGSVNVSVYLFRCYSKATALRASEV